MANSRRRTSRMTRRSQDQTAKGASNKKTKKKDAPKRPTKRMTNKAMATLCDSLGEDSEVRFWFDGPKDWTINGDGTFSRKDRALWTTPCCWIEHIVNGTSLYAETDEADDGEDLRFMVEGDTEELGNLGGIYAIEVISPGKAPPKEVRLASIGESMKFNGDGESVSIGCKQLDRDDALLAFKALGEWLGYYFPEG